MSYTLGQISGFIAVAEELHFGRAASRLRMTQPPLSRQIQQLERALSTELFHRHTRGVRLTAAGTQFLADARRLMGLLEEAEESVRRTAAGERGTLRIGFTPISAHAVLPALLKFVQRQLPDVSVALSELSSAAQCEEIRRDTLDLGLVRAPVAAELSTYEIHREDLVLVISPHHAMAQDEEPVRLEHISPDLIGHSPEGPLHLRETCAALVGLPDFLRSRVTGQVSSMLAMVRTGHGTALVPRSCLQMASDLVVRELARGQLGPVALHVCTRPEPSNPITEVVVEFLRSQIDW